MYIYIYTYIRVAARRRFDSIRSEFAWPAIPDASDRLVLFRLVVSVVPFGSRISGKQKHLTAVGVDSFRCVKALALFDSARFALRLLGIVLLWCKEYVGQWVICIDSFRNTWKLVITLHVDS